MDTVRLTTAQAIVRCLVAQRTVDRRRASAPLFPGVFAIFGHGNVTCLGEALHQAGETCPTWRGQNEQGMALAAVGYAKAIATSPDHGGHHLDRARRPQHGHRGRSGPRQPPAGAAAVRRHLRQSAPRPGAAAGRALRRPDPHRQRRLQAGHPVLGPHRAPRAVLPSLPQAVATMLDPATCGPAFIGLPQDVQAEAYDYPEALLRRRRCTTAPGPVPTGPSSPRPSTRSVGARRPLIVAGGGVHYSRAEGALAAFAETLQHPRRRDGGRQGVSAGGPPAERRADRRHRVHVGQRARRRSRRRPRGRHPAAGFHHWLVDGVRQRAPGSSASTPPRSTP